MAKKKTTKVEKTNSDDKSIEQQFADAISKTEEIKKETEASNFLKSSDEKKPENVSEGEVEKTAPEKTDLKTEATKEQDRIGFYNFSEQVEYTSDYDTIIENNRVAFVKLIKIDRIVRFSIIGVCLFLFLFSWLYILQTLKNNGLGYGLIAGAAAMMIIYLIVTRGLTANYSNNYLDSFYQNSDLKIFGDKSKYQNLMCNTRSKLHKQDFINTGAYKDISRIVSKNDIEFNYQGNYKVKISDAGVYSIGNDKYERPVFVGKFVQLENKYTEEQPIYIYLKGYKFPLPPNAIDEVIKVYNSENLMIQTDNKEYKKHISDKTIETLDKYVCNNVLLDATIIIRKGITYMCLGYSDEFATIPFKMKYNPGPFKQYLSDLDLFLQVNSEVK